MPLAHLRLQTIVPVSVLQWAFASAGRAAGLQHTVQHVLNASAVHPLPETMQLSLRAHIHTVYNSCLVDRDVLFSWAAQLPCWELWPSGWS